MIQVYWTLRPVIVRLLKLKLGIPWMFGMPATNPCNPNSESTALP